MGNKKVLWIKDNYEGTRSGALIDAADVEQGVYFGDNYVLIWDGVPGEQEPTIPEVITWEGEEYDSIKEMYRGDAVAYLDNLVGSESRMAGEWESVADSLIYDFEYGWDSLNCDCVKTPAYQYFENSNPKTVYLGDCDSEYEIEILSTYNLDYIDYGRNRTNYEYGGIGNHAKLHKVLVDGNEPGLLWHEWSQWQGSELDQGELISEEEVLSRLEDHPELKEIKKFLAE